MARLSRILAFALVLALLFVPAAPVARAAGETSLRSGYTDALFGWRAVQTLWSYDAGGAVFAAPVSDGAAIYAGSDGGRFFAVDARTGQELWCYQASGAIKKPAAIAPTVVVITTLSGDVIALDRATGAAVWRVSLAERIDAGPAVIGDRVIVPCSDGSVSALALADGSRLWKYAFGFGVRLLSTPAAADAIYVERDGALSAIAVTSGDLLWSRELKGEFRWWPVLSGDRVVSAGSGDSAGGLSVIAAASGEQLARYVYAGDNHWAAPAVDAASGDIYAGIEGGVFRFDTSLALKGKWVGQAPATASKKRYVMWQPIIARHLVIVPGHLEISTPDALFFFDRNDGLNYLGKLTLPEKLGAQPLMVGDVMVYGSASGRLIALAPIRVTVNGASVDFGLDQPVQSETTSRVILPIRPVIEAAGGSVGWDQLTQSATVSFGGHTVVLTIGQRTISVDGQPVSVDEPPQLRYERTMLPIRAVIEGLGGTVSWEQLTQTVTIMLASGQ